MTQTLSTEPISPSASTTMSYEQQQLNKINAAVDTTLIQLDTTSRQVIYTITRVFGIKWFQLTTHKHLSNQHWRQIQQHISKLTYTCAGVDEALMRHLFSLDAITGDDAIRTLRRTSVHRIKHAITQIEKLTTKMIHLAYIWKKIKHEEEETQVEMNTETPTTPSTPSAASATSATTTQSKSSPAHNPTKSRSTSNTPTASPQQKTRSMPSSPQQPTRRGKTTAAAATKPPVRSPLKSRSPVQSASVSPIVPPRHLAIPSPVRVTPPAPSSPRFHVTHRPDAIVITASLPSVTRDSLDITVRGHLLRIAGVCADEPFLREMELPDTCDVDHLDAAWDQDQDQLRIQMPNITRKTAPTQVTPPQQQRYGYGYDHDMDCDQETPCYQPAASSRCAPSYARPSYLPRSRPTYTSAPPRSMFGSPFGFW